MRCQRISYGDLCQAHLQSWSSSGRKPRRTNVASGLSLVVGKITLEWEWHGWYGYGIGMAWAGGRVVGCQPWGKSQINHIILTMGRVAAPKAAPVPGQMIRSGTGLFDCGIN